jgi:hypothetical protein
MDDSASSGISLTERLLRPIFAFGGLLAGVHVWVELTWRGRHSTPNELVPVLAMNSEQGIVTWLTVSLTFAVGACAVGLGALERRRAWFAVGALFLYLSADDHAMIHERIGWLVQGSFGSTGIYAWILVLGPVFAVLGLLCLHWLWRALSEDPRGRRRACTAFACMAVALLFELAEKALADSGLRLRGFTANRYTIPLEELLELAAPALLLATFGARLEHRLAERRDAHSVSDTLPVRPRTTPAMRRRAS